MLPESFPTVSMALGFLQRFKRTAQDLPKQLLSKASLSISNLRCNTLAAMSLQINVLGMIGLVLGTTLISSLLLATQSAKSDPSPQAVVPPGSAANLQHAPQDNLGQTPWWQMAVMFQVKSTRDQQFNACLFGDSITSALGNTLGKENFNFALGGMSTTSLLIQLNRLVAANVRCQKVVIAIGTNDAWYGLPDQQFVQQLTQAIALAYSLRASQITLMPAFYSTLAASKNPRLAGTLQRVNEINALIEQVAEAEQLVIASDGIQALYKDQSLNSDLTIDGVHLNPPGKKILRKFILSFL